MGLVTPINRVVWWGLWETPGRLAWLSMHAVGGLVQSTVWPLLIHSLG
jgi:hypothetical protein